MNFILIGTSKSPSGRGLLQEDRNLYVLSKCCTEKYEDDSVVCSKCSIKDSEISHWRTYICLDEGWTKRADIWRSWGKDIFGYEDFEVKIEEK